MSLPGVLILAVASAGLISARGDAATLAAPTALLEVREGNSGPYTTASCVDGHRPDWSLRGTGSTDPDIDIATWSINFGDTTSTGTQSWAANPPTTVLHTYPDQGDYFAVLTVTDTSGASHSDTTQISILSIGEPPHCAPTAVTIRSLRASSTPRGILIHWTTAFETEILGFNVWRYRNGKGVKVNRALIRAKRSGKPAGASYRYIDYVRGAKRGLTYRLQLVDLKGQRTWYVAFAVAAK